MRYGNWIETYSGIKFWPLDPRPEEVSLVDIAHALSMLCRANGHCKYFYSVAQHSINVYKELAACGHSPRVQLLGLLHDASEAYLSDITRPVKQFLPQYIDFERTLQATIFQVFDVIPTEQELKIVSHADNTLLAFEVRMLMNNVDNWATPVEIQASDLSPLPIMEVEKHFLHHCRQLQTLTKNL